ncbi:hypothetical protein [Phocaeicola sp.]
MSILYKTTRYSDSVTGDKETNIRVQLLSRKTYLYHPAMQCLSTDGIFNFLHKERMMPVSDNERLAIQHRLAKKKRAELILRKLEEMAGMSKSTDKKYKSVIGAYWII